MMMMMIIIITIIIIIIIIISSTGKNIEKIFLLFKDKYKDLDKKMEKSKM